MKFKVSLIKHPDQKGVITKLEWNNLEEVFSCSDNHIIAKWNLSNKDSIKFCELPSDVSPIDFHIYTKSQNVGGTRKSISNQELLLTSADGKFHLIGKTGRIEKSIQAHNGATLVGQWSPDGAGILTAGEDGQVKIWSRNGLLRTLLWGGGPPVYSAVWSPNSDKILFTQNNYLVIKPLSPNYKTTKWPAHDGLILKVAWCASSHHIISGGEDCKYKMWDIDGRQLYSSLAHDHPISSLAWAPGGEYFAVGSFNILRLCDKVGWAYSMEKLDTGNIYNLVWSNDGTQVAGACANGNLLFGYITQRKLEWQNYEALQMGKKSIHVLDVLSDTSEKLDLPDRLILMALGYSHLVLTSPTQCFVYATSNFNTPHIFELKNSATTMILLAEKYFLLVDQSNIGIYSYDGRLVASPKWPNMLCDQITMTTISLSSDYVVVRDQVDSKVTHIFEISASSTSTTINHENEIIQVALNQMGSSHERHIAFIDKNRDLFISTVSNRGGAARKSHKLGIMVQFICWNTNANILVAMQDAALCIWFFPAIVFADSGILRKTVFIKDIGEFGQNPSIVSFVKNHITLRKYDGSIINYPITPYISMLHSYTSSNSWNEALRMCRALNDEILWACLAGMATFAKELETAEEAYAAIEQVDKVIYINHIKSLSNKAAQQAEICLLGGNIAEAEKILLHHGLMFKAIQVNILSHNWERALDLALSHKTHVDTVLYQRKKYLESLEKIETNEKYIRLQSEIELDEEKIQHKLDAELSANR